MPKPLSVSIRTYQVGFGDCFLMSIAYDDDSERHVLIDFGTTEMLEGMSRREQMDRVATDIAGRSNGKLAAIIATHRHQDHIYGFGKTAKNKGSGAIIASLNPDLVCQPWTEHPDIPTDATAALPAGSGTHGMAALIRSLASMQKVSAAYVQEARDNSAYLNVLGGRLRKELMFIGEDNISNKAAVTNLKEMGHDQGKGEYLHAGQPTRLSDLLECDVLVLGPPTVEQHAGVKKQRSTHAGEYWHLSAHAMDVRSEGGRAGRSLFPDYVTARIRGSFPADARWLINRAKRLRGNQMLQIVRMLDKAMNNTSLIMLFRIGSKSFLFPGDAQLENWEFALENDEWMDLLADVDVFKVGHHGSLNATPKTLWRKFAKRSADPGAERMKSLMSTLEGKHGNPVNKTEVPRDTLVTELRRDTEYFTTQDLQPNALFRDTVVDVS